MTFGVASLVLVRDKALSTLLGDSENPSHTQWQTSCSHYRDKYEAGVSNINFVADSVAEIMRLISETDAEEDEHLLIDIFALPETVSTDEEKYRDKSKKTKDNAKPTTIPKPKPRRFSTNQIEGGFSISRGDVGAPKPQILLVQVAYDDRTNNPLLGWYPTDFDLSKLRISVPKALVESVQIVSVQANELQLRILQEDFLIKVTGFDPSRNLYIRVIEKAEEDGGK